MASIQGPSSISDSHDPGSQIRYWGRETPATPFRDWRSSLLSCEVRTPSGAFCGARSPQLRAPAPPQYGVGLAPASTLFSAVTSAALTVPLLLRSPHRIACAWVGR